MYRVKPGRAPALLAVVLWIGGLSSIGAIAIAWASGAEDLMPVFFGIWFGFVAIAGLGLALWMAFGKHRPSIYEIIADREGESPAAAGPEASRPESAGGSPVPGGYCPYCGSPVEGDFEFCPKCGKKI